MQSPSDTWTPAQFPIALIDGVEMVDGYQWRGLGLRHHGWAKPRSNTIWTLTHLGSGMRVGVFRGGVRTVFSIAGRIAECSDWTIFDLPDGWKQTDPDLRDKVQAITDEFSIICTIPTGKCGGFEGSVRRVIAIREGLDRIPLPRGKPPGRGGAKSHG